MPPHHPFCKCGSRQFDILSVSEFARSVKMKCRECGKISRKKGRYIWWFAKSELIRKEKNDNDIRTK
jgi:hypothetical protein